MLTGSPQNHTDVASLVVSRGLLVKGFWHVQIYYIDLFSSIQLQQAGLRKTVQLWGHADMRW